MKNTAKTILWAGILGLILSGCSNPDSSTTAEGKLKVIAAFYPLELVAATIGGNRVSVENVTAAGVEPHDLELTPSQVVRLDGADLLLFISGFQPALEEAAQQSSPAQSLDVLTIDGLNPIKATEEGHSHDGATKDSEESLLIDPHMWLDPQRLAIIADAVTKTLSQIDPAGANYFRENQEQFALQLGELNDEFTEGLASCERTLIVTSHAAFGYLADAFGLKQESISGLSPESEPTPKRLAQIGRQAKADGTTTIFFETLASPKVAQTLAQDLNIVAAVLDPLEGITRNQTYFSVMRSNLEALRKALNCK